MPSKSSKPDSLNPSSLNLRVRKGCEWGIELVWWFSCLILILAVLNVAINQILIVKVPQQVKGIEYWLSQQLNAPVRIESLNYQANFFSPAIEIKEFRILQGESYQGESYQGESYQGESYQGESYQGESATSPMSDHQVPALSFSFCQFGIDVVRSLWRRQPVLSFFHIDGAQIELHSELSRELSTDQENADLLSKIKDIQVKGLEGVRPVFYADQQQQETKAVIEQRYSQFYKAMRWLDRLIETQGIVIQDARLAWSIGDKAFVGKVKRATLAKWEEAYQIKAQVIIQDPSPVELVVKSHIRGESLELNTWNGQVYVQSKHIDVAAWAEKLVADGLLKTTGGDLVTGVFEAELWTDFANQQVTGIRGSLNAEDWLTVLETKHKTNEPLAVEALSLNFLLKRPLLSDSKSWESGLYDIRLQSTDLGNWWLPTLYLGSSVTEQEKQWRFRVPEWNLADFERVAQWSFLKDLALKSVIDDNRHQVTGKLKNVVIEASKAMTEAEAAWQLAVMGGVEDLGVKNDSETPESEAFVSGIDARFAYFQEDVAVVLETENAEFFHPKLFRTPTALTDLKGPILLEIDAQSKSVHQLQTGPLSFSTSDAKARLMLRLESGVPDEIDQQLWAQLAIEQAQGNKVGAYLPVGVMKKGVVSWLDQAIVGGDLEAGNISLRLNLEALRDPVQRSLAMSFDVADAVVDYLPPWPPATEGIVDVNIFNKHVDVSVDSAKLLDATVEDVQVYLGPGHTPTLRNLPARLSLQGSGQGDSKDGLATLNMSPLRKKLETFLDAVQLSGEMALDVTMDLPLNAKRDDTPPHIMVAIDLSQNRLLADKWRVELENLQGAFTYDSEFGLRSPSWQAQFLGAPVEGSIKSRKNSSGVWGIGLSMAGPMPIKNAVSWLNLAGPFERLDGEVTYQADLSLNSYDVSASSQQVANQLRVTSSLEGGAADWPAPFQKATADAMPMTFQMNLDASPPVMDLEIKDLLSLNWQMGEQGLLGGWLHFGDRPAYWQWQESKTGLYISGQLPEVTIDDWLTLFSETASETKPSPEQEAKRLSSFLTLSELSLDFEALTWGTFRVEGADFDVKSGPQSWSLGLASSNLELQADIPVLYWQHWLLSNSNTPLPVNQQYFIDAFVPKIRIETVESNETDKSSEAVATEEPAGWQQTLADYVQQTPDLMRWFPAMNVHITDLAIGDDNWGRWQAQLRPTRDGLGLEAQAVDIQSRALAFKGDASWRLGTGLGDSNPGTSSAAGATSGPSSTVKGIVSVPDMAQFMATWELPKVLESKNSRFEIESRWSNHIFQPEMASLVGQLKGNSRDGRLLNTDADVSPIRFLGLLNIDTITRRLKLDFSDIFSKGLAYDKLDVDVAFENQLLTTHRLHLKGPSLQLDVAGTLDWESKVLDKKLAVTVPLSRNLVLPAAATGGLPAAATALLIEQVFGDKLDKLTTLDYDVSGTIMEPVIAGKELEGRPATRGINK